MQKQPEIAVIACGVLEWNVRRLLEQHKLERVHAEYLPAEMHANPRLLQRTLQERIDELDAWHPWRGIVLGFGVCGRGTVNLRAGRSPLVIPRVQDCIGIWLGSHERYLEEFKRRPGTRYVTQGYYEKTVLDPNRGSSMMSPRDASLYGPEYPELAARYGAENAAFICEFRNSWRRNYQRAAYIHFAGETAEPPGARLAQATAGELDWEFACLPGDESLLLAVLRGDWEDPRVLVVQPGGRTASAPGRAVLESTASPAGAGLEKALEAFNARLASTPQAQPARTGLGLGIDTGGTFTDAVVYDFAAARVLASAKAPTTHGDLAAGIRAVLRRLPDGLLPQVQRVGLSTTLATNAFVEKKGRPVGLLLMSPTAVDRDRLPFRFVREISGAMSMDGEEISAPDHDQVRRLAAEAVADGCEAFAISGFAGGVNPAHELAVAATVVAATGLHTVCGHELSSALNFVERAITAAMNARLVPLVEELFDAVHSVLGEFGLAGARIMVVKGDGSQVSRERARLFPVETVLSGPAASVVGAACLFRDRDCIVADMGGTTLDVAMVSKGLPRLSEAGARVGEFQTCIRAMDIHTVGLGGDSEIDLSAWPKVRIGPRRIVPICRLRERLPAAADGLARLLDCPYGVEQNGLDLLAAVLDVAGASCSGSPNSEICKLKSEIASPAGQARRAQLSDGAARLLAEISAAGPLPLSAVARRLNRAGPKYLAWQELEDRGRVQRFGLTLTDIMHLRGAFDAFDRAAAALLLDRWAELLGTPAEVLADGIMHEFRAMLLETLAGTALQQPAEWRQDRELRSWLARHVACLPGIAESATCRFNLDLGRPLVGVGAPAPALFPVLAPLISREVLISEHAAVANALGAIAGNVLLRETAHLRLPEENVFLCSWRGGSRRFADLVSALETAKTELETLLREAARLNGLDSGASPRFTLGRHEALTTQGKLLLGLTLTAEICG